MPEFRSTFAQQLGAAKVESTLLVLFIPSVDRDSQPIDQATWVHRALETLGALFGERPVWLRKALTVGWCLTSPS